MNCKIVTSFIAKYSEFPELLFASDNSENLYFDATLYIKRKGDVAQHSPVDFANKFKFWVDSAQRIYEIDNQSVMVTDDATGHILIDESLALLFVCYIDPQFSIYIVERISEMLLNGFVLSDTSIAQMASDRLNL
ncbi:MAG: hypothetical protein SNH27_13120 [Rikenellaceae bacterium]